MPRASELSLLRQEIAEMNAKLDALVGERSAADIIDTEEAARMLGVKPATVYKMDLPRYRHGRLTRYRRSEIAAYLTRNPVAANGGITIDWRQR